jgi:hypothetical protein
VYFEGTLKERPHADQPPNEMDMIAWSNSRRKETNDPFARVGGRKENIKLKLHNSREESIGKANVRMDKGKDETEWR